MASIRVREDLLPTVLSRSRAQPGYSKGLCLLTLLFFIPVAIFLAGMIMEDLPTGMGVDHDEGIAAGAFRQVIPGQGKFSG